MVNLAAVPERNGVSVEQFKIFVSAVNETDIEFFVAEFFENLLFSLAVIPYEAKIAADDFAARADETVKQAARDTVLKIREAITALLEGVLVKNVEKALADEKTAVQLAGEAIKDLTGNVEIAAGEKLVASLKAQLANKGEIAIVTDENVYSGFSVKIDGGRVEHAFTAEVVAEELSKRLRPELARLLK